MISKRPYILVPLQLFKLNPKSDLKVAAARDTYLKKLEKYELTPLFISPYSSDEVADDLYQMSAGVFFMGGSDFDPEYYGAKRHLETEVTEADRDRVELRILKQVLAEKSRPFLGICRGCQALCVASGGSLVQHVPDLFLTGTAAPEKHDVEFYHELLTAEKHPVTLEPGSRISTIVGTEHGNINSAHHQAVKTIGPDLKIAAHSPGGVVEAIEHVDKNFFCIGLQAHPEAEEDGLFEKVFSEFAETCRNVRISQRV